MKHTLTALALLLPTPLLAKGADAPAKPGIVSAADPRAAQAGADILKQGGTATDAAIATMLVLNVVEPQNSGIAGGSFMVYHDAKTGKTITLDGREAAPHAADAKWFYGDDGKPLGFKDAYPGGRSVGVPGNLRMLAVAHQRYGKLPWASLFAPAIKYARDGFTVSARMHNGLELYGRHVEAWGRAHMFTPDGHAVAVGSTFRNPEQATLFDTIAKRGVEPFYTGPEAQKIVAAVNGAERNKSKMTLGDLATYQVKDRASVCGSYRGYKICGMGPPSSGAISVLMILKQLERFDMAKLGPASPVAWHLFAESSRLAYADRDMYIADPDYVAVPIAGLLDARYIAQRSALISPDRSLATIAPGMPAGAPKRLRAPLSEVPGTSDLATADAAGNVVQVTTTIDGYFGSGISVDGVWLNNELTDFDIVPEQDGYLVANRVEGGKRPRSSMSPTIVYGPDGKVRLAIGAAGGSTIIAQVAKAIIGVIDWKMTAQDAIATGLLYAPGKGAVAEAGTPLVAMVPALQALGEDVKAGPLGLKANAIEQVGGVWVGAADPRSEGVAVSTDGTVTRIARRSNELNGAHE